MGRTAKLLPTTLLLQTTAGVCWRLCTVNILKVLIFFCPISKKLTVPSRRPETSRGVREQLRLRAIEEGGTDSSRFLFLVTLRDLLAWTA